MTVNLGVVCIRMRREMMTFNELQQVGSVTALVHCTGGCSGPVDRVSDS